MSIIKTLSVALALSLPAAALAQPGTIDPSFNGGVPVAMSTGIWAPGPNGYAVLNSAVVESSGKAVVLGHCNNVQGGGFGAMRFNLDGSIDTTFGSGGTFEQTYIVAGGGGLVPPFQAGGVGAIAGAVGAGDRLVLLDDRFQLVCLTANGVLDTSFGTGGRVSMTTLGNLYWYSGSLAIQADGKIVISGDSTKGKGTYNATIARLNANGSLDTTFGNLGHGSTPGYIIDTHSGSIAASRGTLAIQPDGRILLATDSNGTQPYIARYLPSGALDSSFGVGGKRTYSFSGGNDVGRGIALTSDGHIILAAWHVAAGQAQVAYLARYTSAGALDPAFGGYSSGWTSMTLPTGAVPGYGIALQSDNSVLLPFYWPDGGVGQGGTPTTSMAAFRYTAAGLQDSTFGTWNSGLSQLMSLGQNQTQGTRGLAVDPSGRIILVGSHSDGTVGGMMVTAIRGQ